MTAPTRPKQDGLLIASAVVFIIATLAALAAVIGGIALAAHSVPMCGLDPYDDTSIVCAGTRHPYAGSGIALIVGGLLQAVVFFTVGYLCRVVGQMRAARALELAAE